MTRNSSIAALAIALAATCLLPQVALAADHTVCSSGCDFSTVQAAVDAASSGDVIRLAGQAFAENVSIDKNLELAPRSAGEHPTLQGSGVGSALLVAAGAQVYLRGFTITGSTGDAGLSNHGQADLEQMYITGNQASYGGILNLGALTISGNSLIAGNASSSWFAGGINNFGGDVSITSTTFLSNSGYNGGALANHQGDVTIYGTSFTGNTSYLGGAVHNSFGTLQASASSFSSNDATSLGGAWSNHNVGGVVTMSNVGYAANNTGSGQYKDCYDVNGGCQP